MPLGGRGRQQRVADLRRALPVGRESLSDTMLRPSVFIGKGLPTYNGLTQFTPTEGGSDFHQASFCWASEMKML